MSKIKCDAFIEGDENELLLVTFKSKFFDQSVYVNIGHVIEHVKFIKEHLIPNAQKSKNN